MPTFDFTNASTLTYNQTNNFLGDGVARLNSTRNLTIRVFERDVLVNSGVSGNWQDFQDALSASDNFAENITLNGYQLGSGVINSVAITDQNPVRVGYHNINISVPVTGNLGYTDDSATNNYYTNLANSISNSEYIKDISEDFSVSNSEENDYEQDHSVTVQFVGEVEDGALTAARNVASGILKASNAPRVGFIYGEDGVNSTIYKNKDKKHYFSESYDLFNKRCTFSKIHRGNNSDDCTNKVKTTIRLESDGVVTVRETGEIKGEDSFDQALTCFNDLIAGAGSAPVYIRCNTAYQKYKTTHFGPSYAGGSISSGKEPTLGTLHTQPTTVGKQFNKKAKKINYDITFTTFDRMKTEYLREYTLNLSQDQRGIFTISENGTVRPFANGIIGHHAGNVNNRDNSTIRGYLTTEINASSNASTGRAREFYTEATGYTGANLKETRSDITYPKYGIEMQYTKEYSDDVSLRFVDIGSSLGVSSASFKSMNVSVSDKLPTFMRQEFVAANKKDGYVLLHEPVVGIGVGDDTKAGGQTDLGQREIKIDAVISRPTANVFTSPPNIDSEIDVCRQIAVQRMADLYADFGLDQNNSMIYVDSCSYTLDNSMTLTFNLSCIYTTKRNSTDVTNLGIITKQV